MVLDLNRDGKVELKNAAFFDLNANGFHEFTRWIDETDAFLVLDKNFNGKADNGSELFGDVMTLPDGSLALTGFDALRAYDSNGDGKIDASDEIYASLKVLTGEGKMASLADAGIKSLNCPPPSNSSGQSQDPVTVVDNGGGSGGNTSTVSTSDPWASLTWEEQVLALKDQAREADRALWESGGSVRAEGTFEWQDGSTGTMAEALPYRIPMYSIPDEILEVPEDIAALPNLMGFGNMHDLRQAMVRDGSGALRGLVEQYAAEKDPSKRGQIFESLLQKWAGVEGVEPGSRGGQMDARQLAFLEQFFGEGFNGVDGPNPNNTAAPILKELYADLVRDMEAGLLAQTHLKPFFEHVEYKVTEPEKDAEGNIVKPGKLDILMDPAFAWLGETAKTDPRTALEQLWGLKKMMADTETDLKQAAETSRKEAGLRASYRAKLGLSVETPAETEAEKAYAEFLKFRQKLGAELKGQGAELKELCEGEIAWQGSAIVLTRDGVRYLYGEASNDNLYGQNGDDVLAGGTGDDYLEGGLGSDTYVYNKGDGHDTINQCTYSVDGGTDRLKFGEGITSEDIEIIRRGNDVTFSLKDGTGSVLVQNWYDNDHRKLDEVEFADGTKWSMEDVDAMESGASGSVPFMSPMQLQAALDDFGASAPASLLSMSAMSEAMGPEDYAGAQLRMDVAVAGLAFDSADSDKVIDFSAVASSANANALTVSMASENGLEKHFEV